MDDRTPHNIVARNSALVNKRTRAILASAFAALFVFTLMPTSKLFAQQVDWIWSPRQATQEVGESECFFRKKFTLIRPEKAEMEIAAGDEYEVYINGKLVGDGQSYGVPAKQDVTSMMQAGVNLIACRVKHYDGTNVGLAVKFRVKERGESRWRSLTSDASWKTRMQAIPAWESVAYNDMGWLKAQSFGAAEAIGRKVKQASSATPVQRTPAANATSSTDAPKQRVLELRGTAEVAKAKANERFSISDEFTVQQVFGAAETGSTIAMAFNEFNKIILSREGGPLLMADMTKPTTDPNRVQVICDEVNTCQGILPLNGDIFVTGSGPDGLALYQLTDRNRDGIYVPTKTLMRFSGDPGEHGPHGLALGPDGMIYCMLGNGSQIEGDIADTSPFNATYEGDLVPRFEDPGGHAAGVKAPGGTIVRMSVDGSKIETVAGGLRNSYDMVFDSNGELFAHDSDMESDEGTSWYRETMIFHVPNGSEMGWRSGWAKFPQYFVDQNEACCFTGRGSPTGGVLYQHLQFPARYHDTMFFADWSEGRIMALKTKSSGSGFKGTAEVFLKGRPLNVCDLDVGQDGALYFCTGGRGTAGGVYRVVWKGRVPQKMLEYENDLEKLIRHPQPGAAWARQNIAKLKESLGENWNSSLIGVVDEARNPTKFRIRAMNAMVLYGPLPTDELMIKLSSDEDALIRARVCGLCGLNGNETSMEVLTRLLQDHSPLVRRHACESFLRLGEEPELKSLVPILSSADKTEANVARRLLERIPAERWLDEILATEKIRLFIQGSIACCVAQPTLERSYQILARASKFMEGYVNDRDFVDLMRAMELALVQGKVDAAKVPALRDRIANEFPSGNGTINRELARLMGYLKAGFADGRIVEFFKSEEVSEADKLHVALMLQSVGEQLSNEARISIINELETAQLREGGGSYAEYLRQAVRSVAQTVSQEQIKVVLENGKRWPNAVLATFYQLPETIDEQTVELIKAIDQEAAGQTGDSYEQLRLGVIAILGQNAGDSSMDYLRKLWREEQDRRDDIVIGLAQKPEGENWAYLVSSLPIMDDMTAEEVMSKLGKVNRKPQEPKHYQDVIELGQRLGKTGAKESMKLLSHWSGQTIGDANSDNIPLQLKAWTAWYEAKWPNAAKIEVSSEQQVGKYSVNQVLSIVESKQSFDVVHGRQVFTQANCAKCHRVGTMGDTIGPDLTTVAMRFSNREIIEAIIDPSKVISDRYESKKILTVDGQTVVGMAVKQVDGSYLVLQSDGERVRVEADNVEDVAASDTSCMPEGLMDEFQLNDIADLVGFMRASGETQSARQGTGTDVR